MRDAGADDPGCLFHGYARWYAAAAGSLIPMSGLPLIREAEPDGDLTVRQEWTLWELAGSLVEFAGLLLVGLFALLVVTSIRPVPRSGRRIVVIALLAAALVVLLVTTPTTDDPMTGWGRIAVMVLAVTAGLAADHSLHLIRYRRRERLEAARGAQPNAERTELARNAGRVSRKRSSQ